MDECELKMKELLSKDFKSSGYAYVVLDSYKSMLICLNEYKALASHDCRLIWKTLKSKLCCKSDNQYKEMFLNIEDEHEYLLAEYEREGMHLSVSLPRDPVDIIWFNLGNTTGVHFMKKYLLNIICLFLIIFVSTPAVVFQTLQSIGANHIETRIIEKLPFIKYLPQSTSTLIILIINILILVMIDQLAIAEKHHQHSKYQTSIFHKATVYLHLNMVVLPFLGFQESSIYQAMKTDRGFKDYFKDLSMIDTTPKFVLLVLQFAVFGG